LYFVHVFAAVSLIDFHCIFL